jgi:spermidine synthase
MNFFVFILFFISGACGLIYEVVWSRMMTLIFGRSILSVGTVLAAFMLGLALGSYFLGKYADRNRNPLRLYAIYEAGVALTAFTTSFLLSRITPVYVWAHATFGAHTPVFIVVRFFIAFALLIIPTVLMGATLPILSRLLVKRLSQVGHELGSLYAINTAGAVAGSIAAGFYLISHLGVHGAINVAVAGNLSVGILAWLASHRTRPASIADTIPESPSLRAPDADSQPSITNDGRMRLLVLWAFALSGLTSFAYEIFWTRSLVFLLGNTTYAFTLMLMAFLFGIALGGYWIRFLADIIKDPLRLFGVIEVLIGTFSVFALPLLFFIVKSEAVNSFIVRFSGQLELLALSNFVIALSLMLLPATLIGTTLPLMGRIFVSNLQNTGMTVGKIYAVNTLGNVVGALLPGLLIMPFIGIQKGILLMAALNVFIGIVIILFRWKHATAAVPAAFVLFLIVALALVRMPVSFQFPSEYQRTIDEVLFYKEGDLVTTKVWVSADTGYKEMSVDGINIGGTGDSDYKQQLLAHLPKLLLKSYHSELSIGLGSGILIGESARHAAINKIVCVEISRDVVEGARYFSEENSNIINNPRAVIVVDDVVNFLETDTERYDIISADEKTAGKYATNSFSYSKEYYALLRQRLAPKGLVIQWMPTDLPPSQYTLALRTFLDGFPHVQLWYFPPIGGFTMTNTVLVGSNDPIDIDAAWMHQVMETDPDSFKGIRKYGLTTAEAVLAHFIGSEETLRRFIPPGPVNSFEKPYYEFYSPSDYAAPQFERDLANHELLLSMRGPDFGRFVMKEIRGPEASQLISAFQAEGILLNGREAQLRGLPNAEVVQYYDYAIGKATWNRNLYNEISSYLTSEFRRHYFGGEYEEATNFAALAAKIYPESSEFHHNYGIMLWKMNQTDLAVQELHQALALNPASVPVRRALASIYESRGETGKASEQWKDAYALDPNDIPTLVGYGAFLAEQRFYDKAIEYLRKAYLMDHEDADVIDGYAMVLYLGCESSEAKRIIHKSGRYYEGNPLFERHRALILGMH